MRSGQGETGTIGSPTPGWAPLKPDSPTIPAASNPGVPPRVALPLDATDPRADVSPRPAPPPTVREPRVWYEAVYNTRSM